jgi:hypothetical protein
MMAALREKESQRKGTVRIFYAIGQKKHIKGRVSNLLRVSRTIPYYAVSHHLCKGKGTVAEVLHLFLKVVESRLLLKYNT